jgi:hypothetical protein
VQRSRWEQPLPLDGRDEARFDPNLQKIRTTGRAPKRVRMYPVLEGRQGHKGCLSPTWRHQPLKHVGLGKDSPEMPEPQIARFRRVISSAYAALEARRQEVNDLNVFPVADGDTGDNMALTLRACLEEVDRLALVDRPLDDIGRDEIVDSVARAALLGARGNSGVILSQLIRGAAEELISRRGELVAPAMLGAAFATAAGAAYRSVRKPAEARCSAVRAWRTAWPRTWRTWTSHGLVGAPPKSRTRCSPTSCRALEAATTRLSAVPSSCAARAWSTPARTASR